MKIFTSQLLLFAFFFSLFSFAIPTQERISILRCPICGTEIKPTSKTVFMGENDGEKVKFCSFACASKFHKRHLTSNLYVMDYLTGEFIPANTASYLIKSSKVAALLKEEMPPYVIAVKDKSVAKDQLKQFDDGEYVDGYLNAKQSLE